MYMTASADLKPLFPGDNRDKYSDDIYLIVPDNNTKLAATEFQSIESWAEKNNLKLYVSKSLEMIVHANERERASIPMVDPSSACKGLTRLRYWAFKYQTYYP